MLLLVKAERKKKKSRLCFWSWIPWFPWQRTISICEMCHLFPLVFSNNFQTLLVWALLSSCCTCRAKLFSPVWGNSWNQDWNSVGLCQFLARKHSSGWGYWGTWERFSRSLRVRWNTVLLHLIKIQISNWEKKAQDKRFLKCYILAKTTVGG